MDKCHCACWTSNKSKEGKWKWVESMELKVDSYFGNVLEEAVLAIAHHVVLCCKHGKRKVTYSTKHFL